MSCNSHVSASSKYHHTCRTPSHHIKFHFRTHQVLNMLSHVLPTSIYLDPSLSCFFTFLSSPELLSVIVLLLFLVQIIVLATSFKNTFISLVVFNCILILVVLDSSSIKALIM